MSGLNRQDLEILRHYAEQGNRELYWNYLAQQRGNDGYGLLALGVVRNDNVPGQVANIYAQNRAREDGVNMSERQWQQFGVDLVRAESPTGDAAGRSPAIDERFPVRRENRARVSRVGPFSDGPEVSSPTCEGAHES